MKQINKSDFFSCFSVYQTNLYDRLKVLAVITMIIDHLGYYIFPEYLYLRLIGRIAFPIFLFLVGFNWNFRRRWSLFFIAIGIQILMQIWWTFFYLPGVTTGNILIVIFWARLLLLLINQFKNASSLVYLFPWVIYMLFYTDSWALFTHNIQSILDYGVLGFLFAFSGFFLRKSQNIFQKIISVFSLGWLFLLLFISNIQIFHFASNESQLFLMVVYMVLFSLFLLQDYLSYKKKNLTFDCGFLLNQIFYFISHYALHIYRFHILVFLMWSFILRK